MLTVLHISDIHWPVDASTSLGEVDTRRTLHEVLDCAVRRAERPIDLVVATGDLASQGSESAYEGLRDAFDRFATDVLVIPGNHDDKRLFARTLCSNNIFKDSVIDRGRWRFVLLDSVREGSIAGELGEDQFDILREAVQDRSDPVAVALHHPPIPVCPIDDCQLSNAAEFLDALDQIPCVSLVMSGHNHQPFAYVRKGVRFVGAPSTFEQAIHDGSGHLLTSIGPGWRELALSEHGNVVDQVRWCKQ